jgi:predicted amidohydrolase YtcJ
MTSHWLKPGPDGTWLAPAFSDRHCHPLFAAREQAALDISGLHTEASIVEALKAFLEANPQTEWLDASPFDRTAATEFLATTLDAVSDEIPITLHSTDHHALWVNTAALNRAGLLDHQPKLTDATIELRPDGRPSGLLLEWSAMKLVLDHQPAPALEVDLENLVRADALLASNGVVSASDAWIDQGMGEVYLAAAETGLLRLTYELWVRVSHDAMSEQLAYLERLIAMRQASEVDNIAIAGIKIFLDGVLGSQTAAVLDAYPDGSFGSLIWADSEIDELLTALAVIDPTLKPHFHAIGDGAVRQGLHAIERARHRGIWLGERKPVVAHAELISLADAPRFARLDVEVAISPQWLGAGTHSSDSHERRPNVGDFAPLLATEANVTFGSDWPVSRPNPIDAIVSGAEHLVELGWGFEPAVEALWRIASGPEWNSGKTIRLTENPLLGVSNLKNLSLAQVILP